MEEIFVLSSGGSCRLSYFRRSESGEARCLLCPIMDYYYYLGTHLVLTKPFVSSSYLDSHFLLPKALDVWSYYDESIRSYLLIYLFGPLPPGFTRDHLPREQQAVVAVAPNPLCGLRAALSPKQDEGIIYDYY